MPKTAPLDKCVAIIDTQSEFFVEANDPVFSIFVMILMGHNRKLVGSLSINLLKHQPNSTNII